MVWWSRTNTHTFFETRKSDVGVLHLDFASEVHIGEALDDVPLSPLWNSVVEGRHQELERRILDVLFPQR